MLNVFRKLSAYFEHLFAVFEASYTTIIMCSTGFFWITWLIGSWTSKQIIIAMVLKIKV